MSRRRQFRFGPYSATLKSRLAGIYYLLQEGKLVYVGQSGCIWKRIGEHIGAGQIQFDEWFYQEIPSIGDRLQKETELISTYRPPHNKPHRGRVTANANNTLQNEP